MGDPERGQAIFTGEENLTGAACISCHSLDGSEGPSILIQGVSTRAEDRQPGMSAEAQLRESIKAPFSYIVEGYSNKMGSTWALLLSDEETDDLVAFLLTQ